jgi:hypothetical protein
LVEAKLWTCHSSSTDCEYVQWAISPESRALNLGEVLLGGNHRSQPNITTDLQAVAPIVIAEPYYAVRQPSNLVIPETWFAETPRALRKR